MAKYKFICIGCGSDRVLFESWVEWDLKKQEHVVYNIFPDDAFCIECDGPIGSNYKKVKIDE